jgi:transposase-like protein
MVVEVRPDYPSDWPAIVAVAAKLGIGTAETLRKWVRQAEVNAGQRPGVTSEESAEIRRLKRENAELRRAMRSSRQLRFSSRRNSAAHSASREFHREPRVAVWGRAGLPRAVPARLADRPFHLLRRHREGSIGAGPADQLLSRPLLSRRLRLLLRHIA